MVRGSLASVQNCSISDFLPASLQGQSIAVGLKIKFDRLLLIMIHDFHVIELVEMESEEIWVHNSRSLLNLLPNSWKAISCHPFIF